MNLDYKILWFEDESSSFVAKQRLVKRVVEKLGFNFPAPQNEIDGSNIDKINFESFDLMLADLNLNNTKGTILLEKIRGEKGVYTEVIFYSSKGESALREELKKHNIDGVYCADRSNDDFIEKVEKVIQTTIKKVQDVNNIRGLVVAETIYLENRIEEILKKFFQSSEIVILSEKKKNLLKGIYDKKIKAHEQTLETIRKIDFTEISKMIDEDILSVSNCIDALQSILKDEIKAINSTSRGNLKNLEPEADKKLSELKKIKIELTLFTDEVLHIRNTLAHVQEEISIDGRPYLKSLNTRNGTTIYFDEPKYIEIRSNLKKHRENLEVISQHIKS